MRIQLRSRTDKARITRARHLSCGAATRQEPRKEGKMNRIVTGSAVRTLGIVSVLLLAGLGTPSPASGNSARVKQALTATSMAPDARGKARLTLRSSAHGKFSVLA